ncbi:MAG TPA: hypothetical protein VLF66_14345, partial [Thermoanaerobaculia bacterium]|nr:hypothetical protein [Thermoanaerobaculia bacterium]
SFEEELRGRFGPGGPARALSVAARRAAAEAALRLRVFARDGDRLWLPGAVEPAETGGGGVARGGAPAGLPEVVLEGGPPEELPPARRILAWGEGPRVAALRERWAAETPGPGRSPGADGHRALTEPLQEAVWHLPPTPPEVVARVAHRGFCLDLALELDVALPGARTVSDPAELESWLAAGGAAAGGGRWVAKAPWSAAGRERHLGSFPGELREPAVRRRIERLLERHGGLLAEPWVERTADFGCAGLVAPEGARLASVHRQEVDRAGRFRGIPPLAPAGGGSDLQAGLLPAERGLLESTFHAAADRLRAAGYTGPFGLDAFRWRPPGGGVAFHPLCELNPRLTFGLVARAAAERLGPG